MLVPYPPCFNNTTTYIFCQFISIYLYTNIIISKKEAPTKNSNKKLCKIRTKEAFENTICFFFVSISLKLILMKLIMKQQQKINSYQKIKIYA